jgi:hypothetical protein
VEEAARTCTVNRNPSVAPLPCLASEVVKISV